MSRNSRDRIEYTIFGNSIVADWLFMCRVLNDVPKLILPYTYIALIDI
jgi:hypothetical protein